jgi:hypothetical protein
MPPSSHAIPLRLCHPEWPCPSEGLSATAGLLWLDRPFAVTAAHVVEGLLAARRRWPGSRIWLGEMEVVDLRERLLSFREEHDLATLEIRPAELSRLGGEAAFYNPPCWPPRPARVGEEIAVVGYPRDQWPSAIAFTFHIESATERRFGASLAHVGMPGRLAGLSGAPAFRTGEQPELVGVVVDSLFHNEVVRAQHIRHMDPCGIVTAGADLA